MKEVHDLRGQLHALLKTVLPDGALWPCVCVCVCVCSVYVSVSVSVSVSDHLAVTDSILDLSKPPTEAQAIQIRQLILGSYLDQIAKLTPIPSGPNQPHVPNHYVTVTGYARLEAVVLVCVCVCVYVCVRACVRACLH